MSLYMKSLSLLGLEYNELSKLVPVTFMLWAIPVHIQLCFYLLNDGLSNLIFCLGNW